VAKARAYGADSTLKASATGGASTTSRTSTLSVAVAVFVSLTSPSTGSAARFAEEVSAAVTRSSFIPLLSD
jgi:hypothetical protein